MGFDPLSNITGSQRTIRIALLAIILLTLPCYCLGAVLLATAPDSGADDTTLTQPPTLGGVTASPTITPLVRFSPTPRGDPLRATSTQLFLYPTVPPVAFPTATITPLPTATVPPAATAAPTLTAIPTNTLPPSNTPGPTATPQPTHTTAPVPTNTVAPQPTQPQPTQAEPTTEPPTPTQDTFD